MTNVNIELMRGIGMYNMISNNIRGGLCTTGSVRYAKEELYNPDGEKVLY